MINNNIFNFFFSFGYFLDLIFRAIFSKFGQNTGFVKYPKEKVEKQKMLKMLPFIICSIPLSWTRSYIKETPGDRCEYITRA